MEITTIPIRYVQVILAAATYRGCNSEELLSNSGISKDLLAQSKARVSATDYNTFTNLVSNRLQDEFCGFMDRPTKLGTFEMMSRACISCPTLGDFLIRSARFNNLFNDSIHIRINQNNDVVSYILDTKEGIHDPQNFLPFIMLGIAHRLFSWVLGQPLLLKKVTFKHSRPDYANEFNFLFRSSVTFKHEQYSMQFSSSYLDMANRQNDQTLEQFLTVPGVQLMSMSDSDHSMAIKVSRIIGDYVNQAFPEFETIAEKLHMTSVTLRRRLRQEGTSYRQIKDDLRRDTAILNLGRGHMTIEQVAESVGFSEPTSFFRAFKRWTGVTPRAYIAKR